MKIKVGLAEDNPNLARSTSANLNVFDNVELLFIAKNGKLVLNELEQHQPDIILMDINMPEMDGIEATKKVREQYPNVKVIMLTVFDENDKIFESILAGACGYLLKDERPARLIMALEDAMEGGAPMSPLIASKALQLIKIQSGNGKEEAAEEFNLTKRELEILQYIAKGDSYQIIAGKLFISPKTVRKHIENIYRKLQVHNKVEAVQLAMNKKLICL
jgi:DNA-binding NarL/FixJ family response regulator